MGFGKGCGYRAFNSLSPNHIKWVALRSNIAKNIGTSTKANVLEIVQQFELLDAVEIYLQTADMVGFKVNQIGEGTSYDMAISFNGEILEFAKIKIYSDGEFLPTSEDELSNEYLIKIANYQPQSLQKEFGLPQQIAIRTFSDVPIPEGPTQTFLLYQKEGFMLTYLNPTYFIIAEEANYVCVLDKPALIIWLIGREENDTVQSVLDKTNHSTEYLYSLEEMAGITIQKFFEIYTSSEEEINCKQRFMIIPKSSNQWPSGYINP